jgi:hypothetical protein
MTMMAGIVANLKMTGVRTGDRRRATTRLAMMAVEYREQRWKSRRGLWFDSLEKCARNLIIGQRMLLLTNAQTQQELREIGDVERHIGIMLGDELSLAATGTEDGVTADRDGAKEVEHARSLSCRDNEVLSELHSHTIYLTSTIEMQSGSIRILSFSTLSTGKGDGVICSNSDCDLTN